MNTKINSTSEGKSSDSDFLQIDGEETYLNIKHKTKFNIYTQRASKLLSLFYLVNIRKIIGKKKPTILGIDKVTIFNSKALRRKGMKLAEKS